MYRINQQEIRALVSTDSCQVSKICCVTNAPRRSRTRRVQLRVDAPRTTRGLQERQRERVGNDDQGCRLYAATLNRGDEAVPPKREPVRHIEGRTADELTVDHAGRDVAIHLITRALTTVLQHPLDVHPRTIRHVHWEHVAATLAGDDRRRKGTTPFAFLGQALCLVHIAHGGRFVEGQTEGAENLQ